MVVLEAGMGKYTETYDELLMAYRGVRESIRHQVELKTP